METFMLFSKSAHLLHYAALLKWTYMYASTHKLCNNMHGHRYGYSYTCMWHVHKYICDKMTIKLRLFNLLS